MFKSSYAILSTFKNIALLNTTFWFSLRRLLAAQFAIFLLPSTTMPHYPDNISRELVLHEWTLFLRFFLQAPNFLGRQTETYCIARVSCNWRNFPATFPVKNPLSARVQMNLSEDGIASPIFLQHCMLVAKREITTAREFTAPPKPF